MVIEIIGFCVLGIVVAFVVNFLALEKLIIPDPCYYHSHSTNKIFDFCYKLSAGEGHPTPTILNYSLTFLIGIIAGLIYGVRKFTSISIVLPLISVFYLSL